MPRYDVDPLVPVNPLPIASPSVSYDKIAMQLAISTILQPTSLLRTMNIRFIPYRVLSGGVIDKNESLARSFSVGDMGEEAGNDQHFKTLVDHIWQAVQVYINHKNL